MVNPRSASRVGRGSGVPVTIDRFIGPDRCRQMLEELSFAFWRPSTVVAHGSEGYEVSAMRVSETTDESWFTPQMTVHIADLDARLSSMLPHFRRRREPWQVTRYRRGGRFDYHLDAGHWPNDPCGERKYTVLLFLNTARCGGETHFPFLDLTIAARAGRLVIWQNLVGGAVCDERMSHASLPLLRGRKAVLVTWVRQRAPKARNACH
jgi:prolyl 4-hydroxylase